MSLLTSLVGAWTYESGGNIGADSSVQANNLTNNNTVTQATGNAAPGTKGALFVAASSQSLSVPSNASLVMGGTSWEMVTWIKFTSRPGAGNFPGIIGKWGPHTGLEYLLYYDGTTSRMSGLASPDGTATVKVDHANIADGVWFFLDLYFDLPNQTLNLRVNDAPATGTPSVALTDTFAGTNAFIAGSTDFGSPFLNAELDGSALWKRLLTATERTELYNAGAGLEYPFPGTGITRRHSVPSMFIG
jgi:hypothetical protein